VWNLTAVIRITLALAIIAALVACTPPDEANPGVKAKPNGTATNADPALSALEIAVAGSWRDPANVARDIWRHPVQTLAFFGVSPNRTVIEITPGGGWYSEILAPLLRENGHYIAAVMDPESATNDGARRYYAKQIATLNRKLAASPGVYGRPEIYRFDASKPVFGAPGSADLLLTFRNVHNWRRLGSVDVMFQGFFEVLKPGGTLGLVEHRASSDVGQEDASGYVGQNQIIAWASAAGFVLEDSSEINANPADTKDHEAGVWSLPPVMSLGDKDRDKYSAIGESDRMTLRFHKPEAAANAGLSRN
jgi:predicted methyltransferase